MKNITLFILSLIMFLFGLWFSPSDASNKYAFYIIAYVVPFLLLSYLIINCILKRYKARKKVYISKRVLEKFLEQDKYR